MATYFQVFRPPDVYSFSGLLLSDGSHLQRVRRALFLMAADQYADLFGQTGSVFFNTPE
jgi:hypothetical protein